MIAPDTRRTPRSLSIEDGPAAAVVCACGEIAARRFRCGWIHATAVIGRRQAGSGGDRAARAVIGDGAEIGAGTRIEAGAVIGEGVRIGEHCRIYPRVVIYPGTTIGNRVMIHAGVVLGADGFGYVRDAATGALYAVSAAGNAGD